MEIDLTNPDDQEWLSGVGEYETLRYSERHSETELRKRSDRILEDYLAKVLPGVVAEEVGDLNEVGADVNLSEVGVDVDLGGVATDVDLSDVVANVDVGEVVDDPDGDLTAGEAKHVARWTMNALADDRFEAIKDEAKEEADGDSARERVRAFRDAVATSVIETVGRDDVCLFAVFVRQVREHIAEVLHAIAYEKSSRIVAKAEEDEDSMDDIVTRELATTILAGIEPARLLTIFDSVGEETRDEDHWDAETMEELHVRLARRVILEFGDSPEDHEPTTVEPLFVDVDEKREYQGIDLISGLVVALYDATTAQTIDELVDTTIISLREEEQAPYRSYSI